MNIRLFLFILAVSHPITHCFAEVIDIVTWQSESSELKFVMPLRSEETPDLTAQRYIDAFSANEIYKQKLNPEQFNKFIMESEKKKIFPFLTNSMRTPFAVVATGPAHMLDEGTYINAVRTKLNARNVDMHTIPLGLECALSSEELKEFHRVISKKFPALLSLGGADIDPSLYGQENRKSMGTVKSRDEAEIQLVKTFTSAENGIYFGICRGHQLYCVAVGGSLYQHVDPDDADTEIKPLVQHRTKSENPYPFDNSQLHEIILTDRNNSIFESVKKTQFVVNSMHHQMAKHFPEGTEAGRIIAYDQMKEGHEGVRGVEATEKVDGLGRLRVLTLQFHPEMGENNADSEAILDMMVEKAQRFY
jgi:putative glutamine amidotransferase